MGKHGPCYHCGVTSTPLWRNGPPEKPVLCNACGSRWRTKGTLANYTPLHARAERDEIETGYPMFRTVCTKSKEPKVLKRKLINDVGEIRMPHIESSHGIHKVFDEDTSNRSSSGSAISNNESCAQYGSADAIELTGPSQAPGMWDSTVPSRKRTCFLRPKKSSVEKLTKDLYTIWHQQQSSCLSGSSEEDLLLESDKPMVSVEIGHGSVLIQHPNSIAREEESEASSLSFDNKLLNSRRVTSLSDFFEDSVANRSSMGTRQFNKSANQGSVRGGDQMDKFQILASHGSPLHLINLQDILNFEEFSGQLTNVEQQKLLKLLPEVDTVGTPDSLKMMFSSCQFRDDIFSFQKLLGEGVFDGSAFWVSKENCKNLQKHILSDQRKPKWVEEYTRLKDSKGKNTMQSEMLGYNDYATVSRMSVSKARDGQHKKLPGPNTMLKMPASEGVTLINRDNSLSYTKGLFPFRNDDLCSISDFNLESYEQDLLVDVTSNNIYPESELLIPSTGMGSSSSSFFLRPR